MSKIAVLSLVTFSLFLWSSCRGRCPVKQTEECFLLWPPSRHLLLPAVGVLAATSCSGIPPTQVRFRGSQEEGVVFAEILKGTNWTSMESSHIP